MFDVAIVGAGPVGMVTALGLVERGLTVTVLERRAEPRNSSRSIGIHPPALDVLDRLGCADEVIAAGVRVREGEVRSGGRLLGALAFRSASPRHPYVLAVPQHVTERMLRARLADRAPGALVAGCTVTGMAQRGDGVRLETGRGSVDAAWVVGADGPRSVVRTLGGFRVHVRAYADRYVMGDAAEGGAAECGVAEGDRAEGDRASGAGAGPLVDRADRADPADHERFGHRALLFLERDGVVESFPLPGGRRRWVAHRGTNAAPVGADELAEIISRRTAALVDGSTITGVSAFGVHHVWADATVRGRVILVGDAAHEISPIGGQGMTLGFLDAAELSAALCATIGGGSRDALAAFEARAARRQRMTARQAFFNTAMGRPRRGAVLAARNIVVRAIAHPRFERRVAAAFTMAAPARVGAHMR